MRRKTGSHDDTLFLNRRSQVRFLPGVPKDTVRVQSADRVAHDAHCTRTLDGSQPTGSCRRGYDRMLYVATDARGSVIDWVRHADADEGWLGPKYRYGEIAAWFGPEPVIGKPLGKQESTRVYGSTGAMRCDPLTDPRTHRLRADWLARHRARLDAEACATRRAS